MTTSSINHIEGADALFAALEALPAKVEAKLARGATRAAAKVIRAAVVARVPYADSTMAQRYGHLRDNIKIGTSLRGGVITAKVYTAGDTFWAIMVEKGTKAHFIRPKLRKDLYINGGFAGGAVVHPGARANPFMEDALNESWTDAVDAARAYLIDKLPEAIK